HHLRGDLGRFVRCLDEMDAALESILKRPFAAATRVDLRFDDDIGSDLNRGGFRLGGGLRDLAPGRGDTEFFEKFFGLVFVNVHGAKRLLRAGRGNLRSHSPRSRWNSPDCRCNFAQWASLTASSCRSTLKYMKRIGIR